MNGLLGFAKNMRSQPTDAESRLWMHLRAGRLQGLKFKRQVPLGPFIVDFVCFCSRLIVEVDGGQHNGALRDEKRDDWFSAQGFVVCHYWNNEVITNLEGVLTDILHHATPSPQPLPRQGGGANGETRPPSPATESLSPLVGERWERGGDSLTRQSPRSEDAK